MRRKLKRQVALCVTILFFFLYYELQQSLANVWQSSKDKMAKFSWTYALLAFTSLASAQSSTSGQADGLTTGAGSKTISSATATIDGTASVYSVAFTVPASADVGPNILPNVVDPNAKQAQALCPGYKASGVARTRHGFTASLTLAGDPVRTAFYSVSIKLTGLVQRLRNGY